MATQETDDEFLDRMEAKLGKATPAKTAAPAKPETDDEFLARLEAQHHVNSTPEKTEQHATQVAQAVPSGYATTTATNPTEAKQENKEHAREDFGRGAFSDAVTDAGYRLLRGATLGFSDRLAGAGGALRASFQPADTVQPGYADVRQGYLQDEQRAREAGNPIVGTAAEVAGGIVPTLATGGVSNAVKGGRFIQAAGLGGLAGAGNTQSDKPADIAKGFGLGASTGLAAEGTVGTGLRNIMRGSPEAATRRFMGDIMESEAGKALPKTAKQLYKFFDEVAALKNDPEIAAAVRLKEGAGVPVLQKKLDAKTFTNDVLYDKLQTHADHPWVQAKLSVDQMDASLAKAEAAVKDPRVAVAIEGMRDELKNYWQARVWNGKGSPTIQEWREWLTKQQDTAFSKLGGLNETENFSRAVKAVGEASKTYNHYLDSLGRPDLVDHIRANNEQITGLLLAKAGLEQRGWKEAMGAMGLTKLGQEQLAHAENGAALAALAYGHPEVAAAVKLRRPAMEAMAAGMRKVNDKVLAPLEEKARAGNPGSLLIRSTAEAVPQAGQRFGESLVHPGGPFVPPNQPLQQAFKRPQVAPTVDTSGYATSTAVR